MGSDHSAITSRRLEGNPVLLHEGHEPGEGSAYTKLLPTVGVHGSANHLDVIRVEERLR